MSHIHKYERSSRVLFSKGFIQFKVSLTVLENNFAFIGSSKDELSTISQNVFDQQLELDEKIQNISNKINPLNSTILMDGKPYIPGSTIKGMIRFRVEHSFKPDSGGGLTACFIKQGRTGPKQEIEHFLKKFGYWPKIPDTRPPEETKFDFKKKKMPDQFCKVCDLFGNQILASRAIFSDAYVQNLDALEVVEILVLGNIIEKKVIPPKTQFTFTININNVTQDDLALLLLGMNLHNDGTLLMGMHKYSPPKGREGTFLQFGRIKLEIQEILDIFLSEKSYDEFTLKDPRGIADFIEDHRKNLLKAYGDQLREFNETETEG